MAFNRRAAVAAGIATICIVTATASLVQGIGAPQARYVASVPAAAPVASAG